MWEKSNIYQYDVTQHCQATISAKHGCKAAPVPSQLRPCFLQPEDGLLKREIKLGNNGARIGQWHRLMSRPEVKSRDTAEQSTVPDRGESRNETMSRLTGAIGRAIFVVMLITTPSILLPWTHSDIITLVTLVALLAGAYTFFEYKSELPSILEFRDAPPFNRIRFFALFTSVLAISLACSGKVAPTTLTTFVSAIGDSIGRTIDVPFSPVRLMVLMLPENAPPSLYSTVRTAAGVSYLVSVLAIAAFILSVRMRDWPHSETAFNVWTNLPNFDPTAGGDVVHRLSRDSQLNIILGFLLPFMVPAVIKLTSDIVNPISLMNPHTLIWTVSAWGVIPASLIMRGIAMGKVAEMITEQRRASYGAEDGMIGSAA
jgi:hypothetical protein